MKVEGDGNKGLDAGDGDGLSLEGGLGGLLVGHDKEGDERIRNETALIPW